MDQLALIAFCVVSSAWAGYWWGRVHEQADWNHWLDEFVRRKG